MREVEERYAPSRLRFLPVTPPPSAKSQGSPRRSHIGEINIGLDDGFVSKGIGSAILGALLDVADNWRALKRVELTVYADNEPAIRLYTSHGFEVEGRHVKAGFTNGQYHDLLSMARLRF